MNEIDFPNFFINLLTRVKKNVVDNKRDISSAADRY